MKQALNKIFILFSVFFGFILAGTAKAVCPACVIAVGAGLGFSRWLGVDDVVSSIWIGAIMVAVILWTVYELRKKKWGFRFDTVVVALCYYALMFVPLYYYEILGHPLNKFLGTDKIIFGTFVGSIAFLLAHLLHNYLKKLNNDKSYFPYQKVVVPFALIVVVSLIFYLIIKLKLY